MPSSRKKPDVVTICVSSSCAAAPTAGARSSLRRRWQCSPDYRATIPQTYIPIDQNPLVPNFDLHRACAAGNLGLVQYAITQGQPVNSVLAGVLPLHAAASGGSEQVVKTLVLAGADVNAPRLSSKIGPPQDVGGIATVVGPSHKGRLGSANSVQSTSSSVRGVPPVSAPTMGKRGSTALHFAAAMGHANIVKILLDCGADPSARDCDKMRPVDTARAMGQSRTARLLEEFEAPRSAQASSSLRYPTPTPVTPSDFTLNVNGNGSTSSLPGDPVPAHPNGSTSSLGRYPVPRRQPSLPSIYESPPATAIPTVKAEPPRQEVIRRPRSAGATGTHSTSRIGRILKKTSFSNARPSTASAALQSPTQAPAPANPERLQTTHHVHTIPLHAKSAIGKAIGRSLQHHHILHSHPLQHISTEDISAPMAHVMGPSRSDLVHVRPDMNKPTPPLPRAEEADIYQVHGGLSAVELHHATTRGMEPFGTIRTAPPMQTVFSIEPVESRQNIQMPRDLTGPPAVPRHRLGLAGFSDRMQTQTPEGSRPRMDSDTTAGSGSSGVATDSAVNELGEGHQRQTRQSSQLGLPSVTRMPHTAPPQVISRERGTSISSMETESSGVVRTPNSAATGTSGSNSPKTDETRRNDLPGGAPVSPASSHEHSPSPGGRSMRKTSHSSLSKSTVAPLRMSRAARNSSPGRRGLAVSESVPPVPPVDTTWVASRAQAKELVEAHRRAIESEHEERAKRKRRASASTEHLFGSLGKSVHSPTVWDEQQQRSHESPVPQPEESSEEEALSGAALRERLAALGTTVQLERRFARGERQGQIWNRSIDATGRSGSSTGDSRAEMLDKYFDPEADEKARSDSQKPLAPPKKDVFGRPITPKEKERRPTTPKDMQTAPPKSPFPSHVIQAPRENRILPPPDKSVRPTGLSPAGPGHMPHRTRSDLALNLHVSREEVPGRDRAWTTTDVRPRITPLSTRPGLSPAIEIVQTSPTPTEGPSPVRQNMEQDRNVRDAIYVEDEHASVMVWERRSGKSKRSNRPSTAPLSPSGPSQRPEPPSKRGRDASASPRVYQSSLPGLPEIHAQGTTSMAAPHLQKVFPPDSPTSSLEVEMGEPLARIATEPMGPTPSAVDLHNFHMARSRELESLSYMPQGIHGATSGIHGYDSTIEDRSWRGLGFDAPRPPTDTARSSPTRAKKITGFFSRLKR